MKLQIRTTFDFGKLAQQMPKILEKHLQRTGRSSAQGAKENIRKGLSPPLEKSTLEIRCKSGPLQRHERRVGSSPLHEPSQEGWERAQAVRICRSRLGILK